MPLDLGMPPAHCEEGVDHGLIRKVISWVSVVSFELNTQRNI